MGICIPRDISCHYEVHGNTKKTTVQPTVLLHLEGFFPVLVPMNMSRRETLSNKGKKWARLLRNTLHSKLVIKMEAEESEDQIFSWKLSWIILDPDDCI